MARPIKQGLDYFPLDVDVDQDDKIAMIEALHGIEGFGVLIKLLSKVYKEGYFYEWTSREQLLFSKRINVDINTVKEIVNDCIKEGFFHKAIFMEYGILTSKGIQKRYLEAVKRRKQVSFVEDYLLIDDISSIVGGNKIDIWLEKSDQTRVNVNINPNSTVLNADGGTQRKGKERKEKESKELKPSIDFDSEFDEFWSMYKKKTDKKNAFAKFKIARKKYPLDIILQGTSRYMQECEIKNTAKNFIKGPSVFLNGENFNDEFDLQPMIQDKKGRTDFDAYRRELENGQSANIIHGAISGNVLPEYEN